MNYFDRSLYKIRENIYDMIEISLTSVLYYQLSCHGVTQTVYIFSPTLVFTSIIEVSGKYI